MAEITIAIESSPIMANLSEREALSNTLMRSVAKRESRKTDLRK